MRMSMSQFPRKVICESAVWKYRKEKPSVNDAN